MKNNRAGLLALLVLVAAAALMVFFVLPRVTGDKQPADDKASQIVSQTAGNTTPDTKVEPEKQTPAVEDATTVTQKMGRLSADAIAATADLKALFIGGKAPEAQALAGAKAKAETTIRAVAEFELPASLDATVTASLTKFRDGAAKALTILQTLPVEPAAALEALTQLEGILTGKPVETAEKTTRDASLPLTEEKPAADTSTSNDTASNPAQTSGQTSGQTASDETVPAFDVLRVEPDGSTVIAGKAEPNTKLDILNGETVISSLSVDSTGDFAAVLDNPLPAGDHQLTLKATDKDGKTTVSEEVATVSVPKTEGGELLAMITTPGKASRIITAPTETETDAKPAEQKTGQDQQQNSQETAIGLPDLPAGSNDLSSSAPAIATDDAASKTSETSEEQAAVTTKPQQQPQIKVTAVEIEGNKIFVAGTAKSGATVAAYADEKLIGKSVTEPEGHFVVEGVMELAVGDHTIGVDMLDAGGKPLVRASVPFNRPAGNVTVAAQTPVAEEAVAQATPDGKFGRMHGDLTTAYTLLRNLFVNGRLPGAEELAAARSSTEIALKSLVEFRPALEAPDTFKAIATKTSESAAAALQALQAVPRDAKAMAAALDKIGPLIAETLKIGGDGKEDEIVQPKPVTESKTETANAEASSSAGAGGDPVVIAQAPLTESKNSVIIRRGDTLWQISRRVYGMGVRYTTIYVANREQINNPDRIRPGQIFGLPKDALPDSEELHRKRLHGDPLN
ncbi:LysM peptidoglycan-binding domain-containing protein [Rhizobium sp. LjRoot30]|uniref:LysM peptidoglycan-binding domain-containing protein n=1 Tax=Rhizobium sp. LjRoot30 TaxID=3342320 RepID=UPI003ECF7D41